MSNEQIIRNAYERAEKVDVKGWAECFTSDGTFTDMSIGVTYRGPNGPTGLGKTVEVYAKAFPDMHRELYRFFNASDVVVVETPDALLITTRQHAQDVGKVVKYLDEKKLTKLT